MIISRPPSTHTPSESPSRFKSLDLPNPRFLTQKLRRSCNRSPSHQLTRDRTGQLVESTSTTQQSTSSKRGRGRAMADSAVDVDGHQASGALQTAKDLFAGAAGGVAQVLLGKKPWQHSSQFNVLGTGLLTVRLERSVGDQRHSIVVLIVPLSCEIWLAVSRGLSNIDHERLLSLSQASRLT